MSKSKSNKKDSNKRFFKYSYNNSDYKGRYYGKKPKQAGMKVLRKIVTENNLDINKDVHFKLRECTRGSKKKVFKYIGKRVKLEKPITVKVGDSEIVYNYTNELKKDKSISVKS